MKTLLMTLSFVSCSQLLASDVLTCRLTDAKNSYKAVSSVVHLDEVDQNFPDHEKVGIESDGHSLDIPTSMNSVTGFDNYSFSQYVKKDKGIYNIDLVVYENNSVRDEVGAWSCDYDPAQKLKCNEKHYDKNDNHIMNFNCIITQE